ncbi:Plac8 family protein [Globisporangium polare]
MRPLTLAVEPRTPTECSDIPYAIQVTSPGPYADQDEHSIRIAAWGAGLCGCFTHLVPNCCMATLCPCVSLAQITSRLSLYRFKTVLCGLLAVAIVQLLIAVVAFAQVHDSGVSSLPNGYYYSRESPSQQHSSDPRVGGGVHSQTLGNDGNGSEDDVQGGTSLKDDVRGMASSFWGVLCILLGLVYVIVAWHLRMKIRERFQIRGSRLQDLLVSLLLPCCSIAQMATHVKSYKPGKCAFGPADVLPAYPSLQ